MEKESMYVEIDVDVKKDFYRFILEKHGRVRGFVSEEVQNAIVSYLKHVKEEEGR